MTATKTSGDGGRPRTLDPQQLGPLEAWLAPAIGARAVCVTAATLLTGGAVQENWRLDVTVTGGARAGRQSWVLRTDAAVRLAVSLDRAAEHAVLVAAHRAGVTVAEPIARCDDRSVIGAPFLIQAFVAGIAQARRIARDPDLATTGPALARALGVELARIHGVAIGGGALAELPRPRHAPALTEVARWRALLDGASEARPALEYVLSWLAANAPATETLVPEALAPEALALVHGDFRTGNYMVDDGRVTAILDWEFAHVGDPDEDIGWFMARCWRFGNDHLAAGGIADAETFLAAYERAAGRRVSRARIRYWQIMAAAKWATIAVLQGDRFRTGGEDALELVLTGLMPTEMESDALVDILEIEAGRGR